MPWSIISPIKEEVLVKVRFWHKTDCQVISELAFQQVHFWFVNHIL